MKKPVKKRNNSPKKPKAAALEILYIFARLDEHTEFIKFQQNISLVRLNKALAGTNDPLEKADVVDAFCISNREYALYGRGRLPDRLLCNILYVTALEKRNSQK